MGSRPELAQHDIGRGADTLGQFVELRGGAIERRALPYGAPGFFSGHGDTGDGKPRCPGGNADLCQRTAQPAGSIAGRAIQPA